MSTLRALVVGVSDYSKVQSNNLPFCINDISAISKALIDGLNVDASNIDTLGKTGVVLGSEFSYALNTLSQISKHDDTLIVYFSGHGGTLHMGHHLLLSDTYISTQDLIAYLEAIPTKNKIIFLDCCMAGDFSVDKTAIFSLEDTVDEFAGKGYAVIASSNATQYSYGHPDKSLSLFTSFLCEALLAKHLIREGKKSFFEIKKLLFLFLEVWNKKNPLQVQNPVFRANMGGTIFFDVQEYIPYPIKDFYEETDQYIIYSVEPAHHNQAKRYIVKIILKEPCSFEEMSFLNHEIVEKVKQLEIYQNEIAQRRWRGKLANLVFCYFGHDEADMIKCNYICHTTWVDDTQDKDWWYRKYKNTETINDIHFNFHSYYESLKTFIEARTGIKENLVIDTKEIISQMATLAEQVIVLYNEFLNGNKKEDKLITDIALLAPDIKRLYFDIGNLPAAPNEMEEWSQCCYALASTIRDLSLYYSDYYVQNRTPENRKACMDISIQQYYKDLEVLRVFEATISAS